VELAERINAKAPGDFAKKTLFLTTGAEAVENAVKIARAHTGRSGVIAFGGGYHGRTLLTLGLTGKVVPYKTGFGPFPAEVFHARFPNALHGVSVDDAIESIEHIFKNDIEASRVQLVEQLGVNEMDLPEVRLRRVDRDAGAVLHRFAAMGVALDAETGQKPNRALHRLAEAMPHRRAHRDHCRGHPPSSQASPNRHCECSLRQSRPRIAEPASLILP
jgi:hypothetical protein